MTSSLSTLLSFRPGQAAHPVHISRFDDNEQSNNAQGENTPLSTSSSTPLTATLSSQPPSNVNARSASPAHFNRHTALDRRQTTKTIASTSQLLYSGSHTISPDTTRPVEEREVLAYDWAEVHAPSSSSNEVLSLDDSEQSSNDDELREQRQQPTYLPRKSTTPSRANSTSFKRSRLVAHPHNTDSRSRNMRLSHLRRSIPSTGANGLSAYASTRGGIQSEPEGNQANTADDAFLELLEVARTFVSMRPQHASSTLSVTPRVIHTTGQKLTSPLPSRPPSPPPPVSMSASTTFALSSSDSPPSNGLASSREIDQEDDLGLQENEARILGDKQIQDVQGAGQVGVELPKEEFIRDNENDRPGEPAESWWDWLGRQFRRITISAGLLGIGFVIAIGIGVVQKPTIRRKWVPLSQILVSLHAKDACSNALF